MSQKHGTEVSFSVEVNFRPKELSQHLAKNPYQLLQALRVMLNLSLHFEV